MSDAPKKKLEVLIPLGGEIRAIHSDELMPILEKLGTTTMRRASHVEPASGIRPEAAEWLRKFIAGADSVDSLSRLREHKKIRWEGGIITHLNGREQWYADLLPVGGPVLGPFDTKQEGLDAEVGWLREHGYPLAGEQDNCGCHDDVGPVVWVVANEGVNGGGGFDWFKTEAAAMTEYDRVGKTAPPGTSVYLIRFLHGGDPEKITEEIDNRLPELEANTKQWYRVPYPQVSNNNT